MGNTYRRPGVLAVEDSENAKIGVASATYVSQASCPASCRLLGNGCYAEVGRVGMIAARLAEADLPIELARAEAWAIDRLTGDRPLRLHIVGDCATAAAARVVAAAARRYRRRRGSAVWTYTHAWRTVPRRAWGDVSVLASCETPAEADQAMRRGYAAALIVPQFPSQRAFDLGGVRVIPCPWQTRQVQCRQCRLCFDDGRLLERRLVIGFEPHGAGAAKVRRALPVLELEEIAA